MVLPAVLQRSRRRLHIFVAGIAFFLAVIQLFDFGSVLYVLALIFTAFAGIWFAIAYVADSGKWYSVPYEPVKSETARSFLGKLMNHRVQFTPCQKRVVTTANLDLAIQEILDHVTRDYVLSWYQTLGTDHERFKHLFQDFIWQMLEEFTRRLQQIDFFEFSTNNIVNILSKHFMEIRKARKKTKGDSPKPKFMLHPWLASEDKELEFLRQAAEVFLIHLLPKEYTQCLTVRHMCREILACSIFKPSIDLICDPDYFNQKILSWLLYREQLAQEHQRTYTYAATYEGFVRIIEDCDDVEHLKQMRYNIISEIMQATTINNLKRAQGIDVDEEFSPKGRSKGDLLKARNLKRYINQLTVAKSYCEKRIHMLGGPDYKSPHSNTKHSSTHNIPGHKVLSFPVIMEDWEARSYMMTFLKRTENDSLLKFWIAVESMKQTSKATWHQLAGDIYQIHITPASSLVRSHVDRSIIKAMEAFMLGNSGPEAFWEAQSAIYSVLEEKHYPSFIVSDTFHHYIVDGQQNWQQSEQSDKPDKSGDATKKESTQKPGRQGKRNIAAHSTYAQGKLANLKEKLDNKTRALKALKAGQKLDEKMQKIQEDMEKEIRELKTERRQLEFHIERTEYWAEHISKWKAKVFNAEIIREEGKMVPYFILVVHQASAVPMTPHLNPKLPPSTAQGWVIFRRLEDFHDLHNKLLQIEPSLKKKRLPIVSKLRFKSLDSAFLERSQELLQDYLDEVLTSDMLAQSEIVFAFFSPSPEHLKYNKTLHKSKEKVSFSNLFKSFPNKSQVDSDSDDDLLFSGAEDLSKKSSIEKDHIAEPLYQLISEVFELKGMFKWLRRTLMAFVQVTFGRSINRQLRETVEWLFSESMLIFYLSQYRDAYWPDGKLAPRAPLRSSKDQVSTRLQAKQAVVKNIPDALKNLLGEANSNRGAMKVFEVFQDTRLNKHLFYSLLQEFMLVSCPELQVYQDLIRTQAEAKFQDSATE